MPSKSEIHLTTTPKTIGRTLLVKLPHNELSKSPILASDLSAEDKAKLLITVKSMFRRFFGRNFGETEPGYLPTGDRDRIALNACSHFQIILQAGDFPPCEVWVLHGIEVRNPAGSVIGRKLEELEGYIKDINEGHGNERKLYDNPCHSGYPGAHPMPNFQGWIMAKDLGV